MNINEDCIRHDLCAATSFTLTHGHLTLLRNANVMWVPSMRGGPAIDPKRPYGGSDMAKDVASLLEWTWDGDEMSDAMVERAERLHSETALALQICLSMGQFKAGRYERVGGYLGQQWSLVKETP